MHEAHPKATPIRLTEEERAELEGLARSTKTEYRLRQRARIVLLAADGIGSRAIGREVGCTTGTASKWRVRYARDRLAGLQAEVSPAVCERAPDREPATAQAWLAPNTDERRMIGGNFHRIAGRR
jgi:hypothetical protein